VCSIDRALPHRLRKHVAERLAISLQRVDALFDAGRLSVVTPESAEPQRSALDALVFEDDRVFVDGVALPERALPAVALLNKPKHVTSTARDPAGMRDLAPYLREMPAGCFPVGRLDRETTGLLLFTNDGELASAVLRPDHLTTKTYWLWLDDDLSPSDPRLTQLTAGVVHQGERLAAQSARLISHSESASELELTLTQGRNRQIRHMCRALDLHLVHLHRRRIGPVDDTGLALGDWRRLTEPEIAALWQAVGGRTAVRERKLAALRRQTAAARSAGTPLIRLEAWLGLS
jgi:23S rRNA pseudouridine2605 synthase